MDWLRAERGLTFDRYEDLWRWSVADPDAFWRTLWDHFAIRAGGSPEVVLADSRMPGARWFPDVRLNYAEQLFSGRADADTAIVHSSEAREQIEIDWGELRASVAAAAAGLRALGVGPGDRVAAYLPNIVEAVIGFLATASIGAIWSSCSPEFGPAAVVDRLAQIEPKVLLAVDGYRYRGREFDRREVVMGLRGRMPSLLQTVIVPYLDADPVLEGGAGMMRWEDLLAAPADEELRFERVNFEAPLWILYSSGTTGLPKAIVQGHGGILLEHLKALALHLDIGPQDRFFWFTTTGWMMWNFLVSGLLTGSAIVLYDGDPSYPAEDSLWDLAERAGVTVFGTSAAYIAASMKAGVAPTAGRGLKSLRTIASTGSPLAPESYDWIYEQFPSTTWLTSISGGTDLCSAFLGAVPLLPVHRGELQARMLGASVEAWDEDGRPLVEAVGELVLTAPMPSMPIGFWRDDDGERYRASYFEMYPGVWRHGDWVEITDRGTAIVYGRSDSTINRGGVRMGTSEIYRAVLASDAIVDALVVDLPRPGTEGWISLFVVPKEGTVVDDGLRRELASTVRSRCSPRHVPDEIVAVEAVPRTLSGKLLEVPVKRILMGADSAQVASRDSLLDPSALDFFEALKGEGGALR
jgi:acetoacetyl-CoA synthetase